MTITDQKEYYRQLRAEQKARGDRRINSTFTALEIEALKQSAEKSGDRSLAMHVKRLALAKLHDEYLVPPDITERMDELLAILRGIGNNLNQLARHSNEMRYFLDTAEVRLQLRRMDEELKKFITAPPKRNTES